MKTYVHIYLWEKQNKVKVQGKMKCTLLIYLFQPSLQSFCTLHAAIVPLLKSQTMHQSVAVLTVQIQHFSTFTALPLADNVSLGSGLVSGSRWRVRSAGRCSLKVIRNQMVASLSSRCTLLFHIRYWHTVGL